MIKTDLVKAIHHLSDTLLDKLLGAGIHDVVYPWPAQVSVSEYNERYYFRFAILVSPGVRLRLFAEIEKDLARDALDRAASETVRLVAQVRASPDLVSRRMSDTAVAVRCAFASREAVASRAMLVDVRLAPVRIDRADQPLRLEIVYEGLDEQLRPARNTAEIDDGSRAAEALQPVFAALARRAVNRALADEAGGIALIDGVTLTALRALEDKPRDFLFKIIRRHNLLLTVSKQYGDGSSHAPQWHDGVLGVSLSVNHGLSFGCGRIQIDRPDRDVDPAALAGKPVASIVRHPFIPGDLVIGEAWWDEGWSDLLVDRTLSLVLSYAETLHAFDGAGRILT